MRRRSLYIGALAAVLLATVGTAEARMHAPYRGHRIVPVATDAPLDGFAAPSGAYSFRKLRSAYAGPAIRIRRASDNLETDINFLGFVPGLGAPWDEAAAAAHCAATTCWLRTWYDQSGNARDLIQLTAGNQPQLIFNCNGTLPCAETTATVQVLASAGTVTPATGTVSFSVAAKRVAGTPICGWLRENAALNRIQSSNVANTWQIASTGNVSRAASDAAWHAAQGVIAGASSVINIDGVETIGTATGSVVAGAVGMAGSTGATCQTAEGIFWDAYINTPAERAALHANQRSYYGTP